MIQILHQHANDHGMRRKKNSAFFFASVIEFMLLCSRALSEKKQAAFKCFNGRFLCFTSLKQSILCLSKSHQVTSVQRWRRWWIFPVRRVVSAFFPLCVVACVKEPKEKKEMGSKWQGGGNNPVLPVQAHHSQT